MGSDPQWVTACGPQTYRRTSPQDRDTFPHMPTRKHPSTTSRGKSREARLQREIEAALANPPRSKSATVIVYSRPSGYWYALARDATTGRQITDASGYSHDGVLRELRGKFPMISVAIQSITDEDPYASTAHSHARAHASRPSDKIPAFRISSKPPSAMTASEINKELDKLKDQDSVLSGLMIAAGRGHERPSEYLKLDDPLALELRKNYDRRQALQIEIDLRYGPKAPSRLPAGRGFGPRSL